MMSLRERLPEREPLILVSNREPYEHVRTADGVIVRRPAGGLVSALDPTMARMRGTWVAWGSGSADSDACDADGRLAVPPEDPRYTLRRVWLDEADVARYYLGFANSVLWPLCHGMRDHLKFQQADWTRYQEVNARFADAVLDEARRTERVPVVWVHDYHFALLPGVIRARRPKLFVHQFWHTPFPGPGMLSALPAEVRVQLLEGMLGNDLLEFQTDRDVASFMACVRAMIPRANADSPGSISLADSGRRVHVRAFPISIDVERYERLARTPDSERRVARLRKRYLARGRELGVCVDRVDYTKGIPERLRALDLLWSKWPELRKRFTFVIVATPSRTEIAAYRTLEEEMVAEVARINARYGVRGWTPIVLINENVDASLLAAIYRAADLCVVSSLQDGMNLVAKEFVACQLDERGVLILSQFTGAAERIDDAVLIDPRDAEEFADGIRRGFAMPSAERQQRMRRMRVALRDSTIFHWLADLQRVVTVLRAERAREWLVGPEIEPDGEAERRRPERRDLPPLSSPVPAAPGEATPG